MRPALLIMAHIFDIIVRRLWFADIKLGSAHHPCHPHARLDWRDRLS
jgi:hypothetical protein